MFAVDNLERKGLQSNPQVKLLEISTSTLVHKLFLNKQCGFICRFISSILSAEVAMHSHSDYL